SAMTTAGFTAIGPYRIGSSTMTRYQMIPSPRRLAIWNRRRGMANDAPRFSLRQRLYSAASTRAMNALKLLAFMPPQPRAHGRQQGYRIVKGFLRQALGCYFVCRASQKGEKRVSRLDYLSLTRHPHTRRRDTRSSNARAWTLLPGRLRFLGAPWPWVREALTALLLAGAPHDGAAVDRIVLEVGEVSLPGGQASGATVALDLRASPTPVVLARVSRLRLERPSGAYRGLELICTDLLVKEPQFVCRRADLSGHGGP